MRSSAAATAASSSAAALARLALARPAAPALLARRSSSSMLMMARAVAAPQFAARCFSAAAAAATPSPAAAAPAASATAARDEYTHPRDLDPSWRSPTQRVLELLRTGPKTRWQLYYALNRGPAAPLSAQQVRLKQQLAEEAAKAGGAVVKGKAAQKADEFALLAHPTGILRNPTHLARILQMLSAGRRVWVRPLSSVESRLGETERKAIADIAATHPLAHARVVCRIGGATAKSWYYVSADWAQPGFRAKGEQKQAAYATKVARRTERTQQRLEEAKESGFVFPYSKPFGVTAKQQRKAKEAAAEADKAKAVKQAVRAYHEELGLKKPRKQDAEQ